MTEITEAAGDPSISVQEKFPYRWGYFQGVLLIPWSLLLLLGAASDAIKRVHDPWYLLTIGFLMGFLGLPLAIGLLRKRRFALGLVYTMLALSVLLAVIEIPLAIKHPSNRGVFGNLFFFTEVLLFWLLSTVYYRKRRAMFR